MPQAFKRTLSAMDAARAMAEGVRRVLPGAEIELLPMADGGDDTLDILVGATGGAYRSAQVQDPFGRTVTAQWGVLGGGRTAVIEMARASGLRLLAPDELDPRRASTYGTGQLIGAALDAGYRTIIVGVGGSATVDCGTGAASALGVRFLDGRGRQLPPGGAALARLAAIDVSALDPRVRQADITVACDVEMPVCGPRGAWTFAAQKGATPAVAQELAAALEQCCRVVHAALGIDLAPMPFAGPAGALAGGLHAFCGARLASGAGMVLELTGAGARIGQADLVITGEGTLDCTSFAGKGTGAVAARAREAGVPAIAVVGQTGRDLPGPASTGFRAMETLVQHARSLEEAMARPAEHIATATAAAVARFLGRPQAPL